MLRLWISLAAVCLLAIAAIAPTAAQDEDEVTIDLEPVEDSGISGTATLTSEDGSTMVSLELSGGPDDGDHPAHIHTGTCDDLGGVEYPLDNVVDGSSESTVEVELDELLSGDYAINVHQSEDEIDVFIACGDLVAEDGADEDGTPTAEETPDAEETPAMDETPEAEETPAADETPEAEETPAADETPEADETPAADETPEAEETPTPEATPEAEETPTPEAEATPEVDETPTPTEEADEVAPATGGGSDGGGFEAAGVVFLLGAVGAVGAGLLLRRRAAQA